MQKHDHTLSGNTAARSLQRFFIVLIALAHLCIGFANASSLSHVPAGDCEITHDVNHLHEHTDATGDDSSSGGHHNAADHSHDKPNVPPIQVARALPTLQIWACGDPRRNYASPPNSLERPPKFCS